jgi:hypothetical protein
VTAEGTKHHLPGSMADESLLACSITEKFEFSLQFSGNRSALSTWGSRFLA